MTYGYTGDSDDAATYRHLKMKEPVVIDIQKSPAGIQKNIQVAVSHVFRQDHDPIPLRKFQQIMIKFCR